MFKKVKVNIIAKITPGGKRTYLVSTSFQVLLTKPIDSLKTFVDQFISLTVGWFSVDECKDGSAQNSINFGDGQF